MKFVDLANSSPSLPSLLKDADADTVYLRADDGRTYTLAAVREEPVRTYVEDIARSLSRTLEHAAGLPPVRVAGYAANIDFWLSEALHCLDVIKGYPDRYRHFEDAQLEYAERRGWNSAPDVSPSNTAAERKAARGAVVAALTRLADRCVKEGLIDASKRGQIRRAIA